MPDATLPATGDLSHVEVNVRDLARALGFWDWFLPRLGWERVQDWPAGRSQWRGRTYIVFVATEQRHADRRHLPAWGNGMRREF